jgi:murein DD-endopeptidase MepM/ murein hydrolase activator NlpD
VQELCRANSIGDPGQVQVDRVLLIPRRGASPVSSRTATVAAQPAASDDSSGRFAGGIQSDVPAGPAALPTEGPASQAATLLPSLVPPDKVVSVTRKAAEKGEDLVDDQDPAGSEDAPSGVSFQLIPSREPFSWPVQGGTLRSEFGRRWGRLHAGVDISVPLGSPVYSARDGQVVYSGHKYRGYGNVVMIDHGDGFVTVYAHNSHNLVREGEKVVRGQMIARVGATGNATGSHCHFEIRHGNLAIDPRKYLSASAEEDEMYATGVPSTAASQDPDRAGLDSKPDPIP